MGRPLVTEQPHDWADLPLKWPLHGGAPVAEHISCRKHPRVAADSQPAEFVRAHVSAFNERDLVGLLDGLSPDVAWQTGADTIIGRAEVGALMAAAFEGLTPSLEIRSVVASDVAAAVEMVEHYRYEGMDKVVVIAAFFAFDGPRIKRVKVYREGSADP
jgi:limonene-1,2-epoxide hydrolase